MRSSKHENEGNAPDDRAHHPAARIDLPGTRYSDGGRHTGDFIKGISLNVSDQPVNFDSARRLLVQLQRNTNGISRYRVNLTRFFRAVIDAITLLPGAGLRTASQFCKLSPFTDSLT
jgi:hypothetical protein